MNYRYLASILLFLIILPGAAWAQGESLPGRSDSVGAEEQELSQNEERVYEDPVGSNLFLSLNFDGTKIGGVGGVDYRLLPPLRLRSSFGFLPDSHTYLAFGPSLGWRYFGAGFESAFVASPALGLEPLLTLRFGEQDGLSLSLSSLGLTDGGQLSPKIFRASLAWALSDTGLVSLTYGYDDLADKRGEHERDLALISYQEDVDESLFLDLGGGLILPAGEDKPTYTLSLGATYGFKHGFIVYSVPIQHGIVADVHFGDEGNPPPKVTRRSNFGENILDIVLLPPALVYIMDTKVEPEYAYLAADDWSQIRRVYEEIPHLDLALGGGVVSSGGGGEASLSYKFAGPYRVEAGIGSAVSRFSGANYYPILLRTFYHYGLFPFFPSGDWRFIGFGVGLVGGLPVGAKEVTLLPDYASLAPSLAFRFGSEEDIFAFLDLGDMPYVSGGISGAAAGVGMSLSDSTLVALMGAVPFYPFTLGSLTGAVAGDFERPMALGSVEQGLGELDNLLGALLGDFLGGTRVFENIHFRLSLGLGTDSVEAPFRAPRFALGISYKFDRLPQEVAVSELMKEAETFEEGKEWARATAKYQRIISEYPNNKWISEVRFRAAQAYERQEMFDEALSQYRILAERFPSSQWNILSQITIGRRAVRDADWREAHKAFINVLATQPTGRFAQEARYWAEYSSVKLEDWERRNIVLEEFTEFYPESELSDDALYLLGESYFSRGRYSEAIIYYQRVLQDHPDGNRTAPAQMKIGYIHLSLGEVDAARSAFERVLTDYPDRQDLVGEAKEQLAGIEDIAED